jgi:hypothetical protein
MRDRNLVRWILRIEECSINREGFGVQTLADYGVGPPNPSRFILHSSIRRIQRTRLRSLIRVQARAWRGDLPRPREQDSLVQILETGRAIDIRGNQFGGCLAIYTAFFDPQNPADEVAIPHSGSGPGVAWVKRDESLTDNLNCLRKGDLPRPREQDSLVQILETGRAIDIRGNQFGGSGSGPGVAWVKRDELGEATAKLIASYINGPTSFEYPEPE